MIQEALEYLARLQTPQRPVTVQVNGDSYAVKADGTLGEIVTEKDVRLKSTPLAVSTLSGLVEAYKSKVDELSDRVAIIINGPFHVTLRDVDSDLYGFKKTYVIATHSEVKPFQFDTFMDPEDFLFAFRRTFLFDENALKVVQLCQTIGSATGVAVADDGISQEVTLKSGTITKSSVQLPPEGLSLIPVRTFRDANPVVAKFLLRMRAVKDKLPQIALIEIDPMWQLYLVQSIRSYLAEQLPGAVIIA